MKLTKEEQEELDNLRLRQSMDCRWFSQKELDRMQELLEKKFSGENPFTESRDTLRE